MQGAGLRQVAQRMRKTANGSGEGTMMRLLLHWLFWYLILGIVASGTASAEECSGTITAEEALRAEDARYAAQLANDFAAMERMFASDSSTSAPWTERSPTSAPISSRCDRAPSSTGRCGAATSGCAPTVCLAILTGYFELEATVRGADFAEQVRFHSMWANRGQGVQFVSWQSTRVPPEQ